MDYSLIIAIIIFAASVLYIVYKIVKSVYDINTIKNKNAKITIENWDGRKYTIKTNSKDPTELKRSVDKLLHN